MGVAVDAKETQETMGGERRGWFLFKVACDQFGFGDNGGAYFDVPDRVAQSLCVATTNVAHDPRIVDLA